MIMYPCSSSLLYWNIFWGMELSVSILNKTACSSWSAIWIFWFFSPNLIFPPDNEVVGRQSFQSCLSIILFTRESPYSVPAPAFLIAHGPSLITPIQGPMTWAPPPPDMFRLVQLGPNCTGTPPHQRNMLKFVHYEAQTVGSRWLPFDWNSSFLFCRDSGTNS